MANVHPDISEYQVAANDSFNRRFLMSRADSEYDRQDAKAPANLAWSIRARAAGKLDNFGVYVIPGFVSNDTLIARLNSLGVPHDCVVMIDWERWGGRLVGDLSALDNDLANKLRARQNGRADLVWGYSNRGDLAGWPTRPSWLGFIIAGYNSNDPRDEGIGNVIGWQYTNGTENHTTYPSSTPPVGACDHNVMFINYPKAYSGGDMAVTDAEFGRFRDILVSILRSEGVSGVAGNVASALRSEGVSGAAAAVGVARQIASAVSDPTSGALVRIAALQVAVETLAVAQGADPAAIIAAAEQGARNALAGLTLKAA